MIPSSTVLADESGSVVVKTFTFRTQPANGVLVTQDDGQNTPPSSTTNFAMRFVHGADAKLVFTAKGHSPRTIQVNQSETDIPTVVLPALNGWVSAQDLFEELSLPGWCLLLFSLTALPTGGTIWFRHRRQLDRNLQEQQAFFEAGRDETDTMLMQKVEEYVLVEPLGRGAMATVYKAIPFENRDEAQAVAVKVLSMDLFNDEEFRRRFKREVRAYQRLNHPNIVKLYAWREPDPTGKLFPYIVLELIRGDTLSHSIPPDGLPWKEARPMLSQLFQAIAYAHDLGVVHRDLKPANVMVSPQGKVKVMDYGLARDANASQLTASGTILGTPAYMAPEQLSTGSSTPPVDQYALGVIVYQMLTGRMPYEAEELMQLFTLVLSSPPTPPRRHREDLDPKLEAVILRILDKDPKQRYENVRVAWMALEVAGDDSR
jgi:tRNA A-37 threonylcarbamoyl transferase component Bud32